jgi:phosphoglycolate phosphatase
LNRLAIFDCDGTLVDSGANICLAMEECFARAELPAPARERTRAVVGLSLVEAMQVMLPDAEPHVHVALAQDYKHAFQRLRGRGLVEEPLYQGILELIDALDRGDWLLGVATGKSDRGLMIGDTSYDMAMARAAGVRGIGVSWGYHSREELLAAGADYIADHPSEIAELVSRLA